MNQWEHSNLKSSGVGEAGQEIWWNYYTVYESLKLMPRFGTLFRNALRLRRRPEVFFRKSEDFFRECESFFRRIGRLLPKSAGFVHTQVSEARCSFAYVSSAFAFGPSAFAIRPSAFAFKSSAFAFVSEFRPSDGRVFESRHQFRGVPYVYAGMEHGLELWNGLWNGMDFGMDYGIKRKAFFVPNSTV